MKRKHHYSYIFNFCIVTNYKVKYIINVKKENCLFYIWLGKD